ncbi:MAG TPA: ABC transporter permease [Burkholderiaceae bacterium]|nr:ABC transporter permease [Burkholderiaceae bacterium]
MRDTLNEIALPIFAIAAALLVFGVFVWFAGVNPLDVWLILFKGAFGDWFSWQNTLQRAAPLMLTALCVAIPARAGLVIIGGEGALVLGGLACAALPYVMPVPGNIAGTALVCLAGALAGALWIMLAGWLRQYRGINETISSLLLAYVAIGLFKHWVEGALRDPASLNKPSTHALEEGLRIGGIAGSDVHWGLVLGVLACIGLGLWLRWTASGFSIRVVGGNPRTAQLVGLPASKLILLACALGGACAGLAGAVEVAAVHTSANASLIASYGYAGILVSFIARHNPVAVIPVAILFGGFGAAGSLLQRRLGLPDASVLVLQGIAFVLILASEALRGLDWKAFLVRISRFGPADPVAVVMPAAAQAGGSWIAGQARNDNA